MQTKKIPLRTCVITREKHPKNELIRIVRTPEGTIIIDETGRANGRGAYIKKDATIVKKAGSALKYHLGTTIPEEILKQILEQINQV